MSRKEIAAFCRRSFLSAVWNRPFGYARKVVTQLGYFFFPDDGTFFRTRVNMGKLYDYALTTLPESLDEAISKPVKDLFETYRQSVIRQAGQSGTLEVFRSVSKFPEGGKGVRLLDRDRVLYFVCCLPAFRPLAQLRLPGFVALCSSWPPPATRSPSQWFTLWTMHAIAEAMARCFSSLWRGFSLFFLTTLAYAVALAYRKQHRAQVARPN